MIDFLVIGASGQVGESLLKELSKHGAVAGTYHEHAHSGLLKLDICNLDEVSSFISKMKPRIVFLPAALTNVDFCERNPAVSFQVNCVGTYNVVRATKKNNAQLVYFSSDYVFDGKSGPYSEEDLVNPINVYGTHKVYAENVVYANLLDFLIIRTTQVFGPEEQKKNFVTRLVENLKDDLPTTVPVDQVGNPTYAPELSRVVYQLVNLHANGIFNVVGRDRISRYEFALQIAETWGYSPNLIQPVFSDSMDQIAKRPLNAGFCLEKTEMKVGYNLPGFLDGLSEMAVKGF